MENKNTKIITGAIIGAAILVAAIIIAVVLPHVMLVNQQVLDLYNKANEAIIRDEDGYGGYYVETNQECRNYIGQAKETMAHSMFVKPSLKRQVKDLDDYIKHYDALNEAVDLAAQYNFKEADEKIKYAGERKEIKESEQYEVNQNDIAECYLGYVAEEVDKANYERISKKLDKLMEEEGVSSSTKNSASYSGTWGVCGKIASINKSLYWSGYNLSLSNMSGEFYINPSKSEFMNDYNNNINGFEVAAIVSGDTMTHISWYRTRLTAADIGLPEYYNDYVAQGYPEPKKLNFDYITTEPTPSPNANPQSGDYLFPSDTQVITEEFLSTQTKENVALIRNEIYARHGYKFSNETYQNYFSAKPWYHENSAFDESQFNDIEKQNKTIIVEYEKKMGWR